MDEGRAEVKHPLPPIFSFRPALTLKNLLFFGIFLAYHTYSNRGTFRV
jgi:hypothetical protein